MSIQTCPTDVIAAPPERIWNLLTDPQMLASRSGARLLDSPGRALAVGDRVVLGPGFGMKVLLEVRSTVPAQQLTVDAHLPFGVVNHEVIEISPLEGGRSRVTYN